MKNKKHIDISTFDNYLKSLRAKFKKNWAEVDKDNWLNEIRGYDEAEKSAFNLDLLDKVIEKQYPI